MIRAERVAAISCTGANLEEDLFNLVAHDAYVSIPSPENLPEDEANLFERRLNRVTDVCIPEEEAIRVIEQELMKLWTDAQAADESLLPHLHLYRLLTSGSLARRSIRCWLARGCSPQRNETSRSTSPAGELNARQHLRCSVLAGRSFTSVVLSGTHYMTDLMTFIVHGRSACVSQSGGGIAGFSICVVPFFIKT